MAGRFSFSFPERRHAGDPWFRVGQVDVTTTVLVAALSVVGMFVWAISETTWLRLALLPDEIRRGQIWRLLTWPLANEPDLWTVITIAIFWYFGREIEGRLGRTKFGVLLLLLAVVPGLVATGLDIADAGIRPLEFGVFLIFVAGNPYARFFFGIPAWVLAIVFVALEVLQLVGYDQGERIIVLAVSIATALITARSMGLAEALPWIPSLAGRGGGRAPARRSRRRRPGGGDVVSGPWTRDASPGRLSSVPQPPGPVGPSAADHAELDSLLDKISAQGMESLSGDEKRRLNELSKRMRGPR